jgi:putative glutamine amidotransferase
MKKIILTQRLMENHSYHEYREGLDIQWGKLFNEINIMPIILPLNFNFDSYFTHLKIDGVFLTGGDDLNSIKESNFLSQRDFLENNLINYCIKNNLPIFGVCRGMQIISQYFGCNFKKINNHVSTDHKLIISNETKYKKYLKKIDKVNSYHNYSIFDLNDDLIISAKSEDGIIEAIEHKTYKIFAQMWHSERQYPFIENELNLIKNFFI